MNKLNEKRRQAAYDLLAELYNNSSKLRCRLHWPKKYVRENIRPYVCVISSDNDITIRLDFNWKKFFLRAPNFNAKIIDGRLNLQSDIKIRSRKVDSVNV